MLPRESAALESRSLSLSLIFGTMRRKPPSSTNSPRQLLSLRPRNAMKLRPNESCPIHRSLSCCGREPGVRSRVLHPGVRRIEDPHHPRGYRELRSSAEMRKLLNRKIVEQNRICAICHQQFTDYNDVVPDHKNPKGMGGAWRDDHPDNVQATHCW